MTRTINSTLALLSISFLAFCQFSDRVLAEMVWVGGHGDIGLEFNSTNNTLGLHIHLESETLANGGNFVGGKPSTGEVEPGDLIIGVPSARRTTRPAGTEWNFTGTTAGSHFWTLPATDMGNHPFVGFAAEATEIGTGWTAPSFEWRVTSVVAPGAFSIWSGTTSPIPLVSADRNTNLFNLVPNIHNHFNMGFTSEGIYDITFEATGFKGATKYVATDTFRFAVGDSTISAVPEPSSMLLAFVAVGIGGVVSRRLSIRSKRMPPKEEI
ncbi:MAG: choice-of-anchor M domain-containing protein [Planctomycetota bacterium]|nr:choice-of-anchor M domain-containing protein [Planctomycetota bacterium]